jgi:hypothetical protein
MESEEVDPGFVADGAAASSARTLDAIERAADKNEDPEVAEILEDASIAADTTIVRIGWVRSFVHRLMGSKRR